MKVQKVGIRSYRPGDRRFLIRCVEGQQDHAISLDPFHDLHRKKSYGEAYLRETLRLVRRNRGKLLMAERAGGPVGFVPACIRPKNRVQTLELRPRMHGTITDLCVVPEPRGMGVGTALIGAAEDYLARNACTRLWLSVLAPNTRAHELYRSLGYRELSIQLMKKI